VLARRCRACRCQRARLRSRSTNSHPYVSPTSLLVSLSLWAPPHSLTSPTAQQAPTAASTRKPPPASIETGLPSLSSSLALGNPQLSAVSASHHSLDSPTLQLVETLKAQLAAVSDQRDMLNTKYVYIQLVSYVPADRSGKIRKDVKVERAADHLPSCPS
jgi:hypothetical protein